MLRKEEHQRGHKEPVPAAASQALPYIHGLTPPSLCPAAAHPFPPPHPRHCACGWTSRTSPGGSGLTRTGSSSSSWEGGEQEGGTGQPGARPHSGGGSYREAKAKPNARGWGIGGGRTGGGGNSTPGGAGRRRNRRRGRRKCQAEDVLSPLRDGVGWGSPAESCPSRMAGRGTETPPQGAWGDSQGQADREHPSQYKAKAAEGQGWECVHV